MPSQQVRDRVNEAIRRLKKGEMVIMVDSVDRENEGDLVIAAELVKPSDIAFMAKQASGLICLTLAPEIVERLSLPMMQDDCRQPSAHTTAFTLSIEAREGITTGISAADRAHTILTAIDPQSTMNDLVVPGHIFPLRACSGGVLKRAGHTEGSVDLARLAGLKPAAVICEVMNEDGSMARMPELEHFAREHGLFIIAIDDLIAYRREEQLLGGQKQASMAHKVTLNSSSEAEQSSTL